MEDIDSASSNATSSHKHRKLDVVFDGGGARGLALNGAIDALEKHGFGFNRLVGTSAGAIAATLVAAGYTGAELCALSLAQTPDGKSIMTRFIGTPTGFTDAQLLNSGLGKMLTSVDIPFVPKKLEDEVDLLFLRGLTHVPFFSNIFSLLEFGGYFSADGFLEYLKEALDADGRAMSGLNFRQMYERTGRHLSLVVSDIDREAMLVLNHITAPECPILWGVRMSMSIPFFWPDVPWDPAWGNYQGASITGDEMVDGGVTSNFALRLLVSDEGWVTELMGGPPDPEREILGLYLDQSVPVPNAPPAKPMPEYLGSASAPGGLVTRLDKVLNTMLSAADLAESRAYPELVCHLPTEGYGVIEFNMSQARIEALLSAAEKAQNAWLAGRVKLATVRAAQAQIKPIE